MKTLTIIEVMSGVVNIVESFVVHDVIRHPKKAIEETLTVENVFGKILKENFLNVSDEEIEDAKAAWFYASPNGKHDIGIWEVSHKPCSVVENKVEENLENKLEENSDELHISEKAKRFMNQNNLNLAFLHLNDIIKSVVGTYRLNASLSHYDNDPTFKYVKVEVFPSWVNADTSQAKGLETMIDDLFFESHKEEYVKFVIFVRTDK